MKPGSWIMSHTGLNSYFLVLIYLCILVFFFKRICVQFWVVVMVARAGGMSVACEFPVIVCNSSWWLPPDDRSLLTCWVCWSVGRGCQKQMCKLWMVTWQLVRGWRGSEGNSGYSLLLLQKEDKLLSSKWTPSRWLTRSQGDKGVTKKVLVGGWVLHRCVFGAC